MTFETVEVEATFTPDGWPVPSALTWAGVRLRVRDVGRRWESDDGRHLLTRVVDGRVFELYTNGAMWWAKIVSQPPTSV
ncbi:MAG: hypothetical protein GYB65_09820 [Chloroflexi bacterium]|nr:hypothetical protein [Chloroflexota bacterium]